MSWFRRILARFGDMLDDDMFGFCSAVLVLFGGDPTFAHSYTKNQLVITVVWIARTRERTSWSSLVLMSTLHSNSVCVKFDYGFRLLNNKGVGKKRGKYIHLLYCLVIHACNKRVSHILSPQFINSHYWLPSINGTVRLLVMLA